MNATQRIQFGPGGPQVVEVEQPVNQLPCGRVVFGEGGPVPAPIMAADESEQTSKATKKRKADSAD